MNQTFMKEKPIIPLILSMALPMTISMLVNALYNIVDSYFVAKISENAMTALSLVFPIQNLVASVTIGFAIGINALIIMKFIRMFLYGAVSVICAFGISMINRNKYIVISIPFMLNYLFEKFVQKGKYPKLYNALVTNIEEVYIVDMKEELIIFGSITILIMALCRIYIGRKCDCGEE